MSSRFVNKGADQPVHQPRLISDFVIHIFEYILTYDIASGSKIMPYNKIDKPLVVYRFSGNVMASLTMFRTKL